MDTTRDMEVEYTPSLFTKRFQNRDDLFNHYIEFSQKGEECDCTKK